MQLKVAPKDSPLTVRILIAHLAPVRLPLLLPPRRPPPRRAPPLHHLEASVSYPAPNGWPLPPPRPVCSSSRRRSSPRSEFVIKRNGRHFEPVHGGAQRTFFSSHLCFKGSSKLSLPRYA